MISLFFTPLTTSFDLNGLEIRIKDESMHIISPAIKTVLIMRYCLNNSVYNLLDLIFRVLAALIPPLNLVVIFLLYL